MHRLAMAAAALILATQFAVTEASAQDAPEGNASGTFGDWTVECQALEGREICTMAQDVRATGRDERLLSARIDMAEPDQPPRLSLILPLGIDVAAPLEFYLGTEDDVFRSTQPRVCHASGCYAFLQADEAFRDAVQEHLALRVRMVPFRGAPVELPLSLRGFDEALNRLFALK